MKRELNLKIRADVALEAMRPPIIGGLLLLLLLTYSTAIAQQVWVAQAPGPNTLGQVENIDDGEVVGAIKAVAAHPTDPNIVYVGAVNGGIWRTTNGMSVNPAWERQTDGQGSQSIGAIEFDPTDSTNRTLVAGNGRFSSFGRDGGALSGLLRTTNGGTTWTTINGSGTLNDLNISGVAPRGATIIISVDDANSFERVGIWRSTNTGSSWEQISGGNGTGLPSGQSADIASDPSNRDLLFTNAGENGLYRSTNAGATWAKVSNAAMDALIANSGNIKIAVGRSNNVYVAIVRSGELAGVFRSGDGGTSWTPMGVPMTVEGGIHPGGQGGIHLSIAADRDNAQIVYVGGDRQETGPFNFPVPNSIGAKDYSGRLFRGDASRPPSSRWVHLTHSNSLGAAGGGTAHGSAPHADSRDMVVAANGMLIEVDDGGIYRRTSPRDNTGDWFSMNGDIQATEFHAVAWDSNSNIVIGGAQDTGTPAQRLTTDVRWQSVSTGDGGAVAVDDSSTPGRSTRYSSYFDLFDFRRQVFDAANVLQSTVNPRLRVLGTGSALRPQFYTPIKLNTVTPTRLIIGAENSVYESMDQGETITEIGPGIRVNDTGPNIIAYGAAGNANMLYLGSDVRVFVRTAASPAPLRQSTTYPGGSVVGIAIDPNDPRTAYVIDPGRVFRTTDSGGTWANITGNLQTLSPGALRSIAYSTSTSAGAIVVSGNMGVFEAPGAAFSTWRPLGEGLPRVPVYHLEYDPTDRILLAGTLGRGAWTLTFPPAPPSLVTIAATIPEPTPTPVVTAPQPRTPRTPREPLPRNPNAFQLSPGVVIDPVQRRAFIMSPSGEIDAVGLSGGQRLWSTKAAAKPLGVVGRNLLGQAEPSNTENALKIVVMEASTGRQMVVSTRELPAGVRASVVETLKGRFVVTSQAAGGTDAVVSWQFLGRPRKGMRPDTKDTLTPSGGAALHPPPPAAIAVARGDAQSGTYRLDLSTGATSSVNGVGLALLHDIRQPVLNVTERLAGLPENQFLSADGRHILVSERVGDDRVWEKYKLTIYERDTGERVGEFRSHLSMAPFFVTDSSVIYETGAYVRRTGTQMTEEPLKIRAVDLNSGRELWSREVRDTAYHGPFPP